jgi:hypothetical protein
MQKFFCTVNASFRWLNNVSCLFYTPLTILGQRKLALTGRNTSFCVIKSLKHLKNLKTGRVPYLGLELTMHVLKKAKSIS